MILTCIFESEHSGEHYMNTAYLHQVLIVAMLLTYTSLATCTDASLFNVTSLWSSRPAPQARRTQQFTVILTLGRLLCSSIIMAWHPRSGDGENKICAHGYGLTFDYTSSEKSSYRADTQWPNNDLDRGHVSQVWRYCFLDEGAL